MERRVFLAVEPSSLTRVVDMRFMATQTSLLQVSVFAASSWLAASASASGQAAVTITYTGPTAVSLHEPIVARFSVENQLAEPIRLDLGFRGNANFLVAIRKPDGAVIQPSLPTRDGIGMTGKLLIRANSTYQQNLLLSEWFAFNQPGLYRVTVRLPSQVMTEAGRSIGPEATGTFELVVGPRDEHALQQVCQRLAESAARESNAAEAIDAARTLSYAIDPACVPWIRWVLWNSDSFDGTMIESLRRVGNEDARAVLAEAAGSSQEDRASLARRALAQLRAKHY
jgi:hypothetical protein